HPLLVLGAEAGVDLAADVGLVVAVGVLQVPDVGGRGDEHPALPGDDAGRPEQAVGEDVGLVEAGVAIGVAEQADRAERSGTPPAGRPPDSRILSRMSRDFWK